MSKISGSRTRYAPKVRYKRPIQRCMQHCKHILSAHTYTDMHSALNIITSSSEARVSAGYQCMKALCTNCKEPTDYHRSNTIITRELFSGQKPFQRPKEMAISSVPSLAIVWWMLKRLLHCQGNQSAPHIHVLI